MEHNFFTAWCAGFFDGEGCISLQKGTRKKNVHYVVGVSISQRTTESLEAIQAVFGGRILQLKTGVYVLYFRYEESQNFITAIRPYLIVKKSQADFLLEYIKINNDRKLTSSYYLFTKTEHDRIQELVKLIKEHKRPWLQNEK